MWIFSGYLLAVFKVKTGFDTLSSVVKYSHNFTEQTASKDSLWPGFPVHVQTQ